MYKTVALAKKSGDAKFEKITIERNQCGPDDVEFDVVYCGICHTDVHFAEGLPFTKWPIVPGHELAGVTTKVGANVKDVKVGDHVSVGCIVDCCGTCKSCGEGFENYCENEFTMTYNYDTKYGRIKTDTGYTYGGYSQKYTVNRQFIVKIPNGYPLELAGPIVCAGITMYSPLSHWGATKGGMRVGVVGLGGLGQMGIRLAKAMGNTVVAISTSPKKKDVAMSLGADEFVISKDPESMKSAGKSMDLILNTVGAPHKLMDYLDLVARDGTLVQIGFYMGSHDIPQLALFRRVKVSGGMIGSIKETQDCIDFCAKKNIKPAIQMVTGDELDSVYEKLTKGNDQIIRYVLDVKKSLPQ